MKFVLRSIDIPSHFTLHLCALCIGENHFCNIIQSGEIHPNNMKMSLKYYAPPFPMS